MATVVTTTFRHGAPIFNVDSVFISEELDLKMGEAVLGYVSQVSMKLTHGPKYAHHLISAFKSERSRSKVVFMQFFVHGIAHVATLPIVRFSWMPPGDVL